MLKLIIEDDEGRKTVVPFAREEITIGRKEGNTIRLTERNVSRRHARLMRQNGHVLIEDLGSYNGVRVNGDRITGQVQVNDGDLIQIGDYDLALQSDEVAPTVPLETPRPGFNPTPRLLETAATVPLLPAIDAPEASDEDVQEAADESEELGAPPEVDKHQATAVIRIDQVEGANRKRAVTAVDPSEAPRLVVLNSDFAGKDFPCLKTEMRIGRTDENDIVIDHRSLSRTHCKVVQEENGEWRVVDMQSANGLMVNGEPYAQVTLRPGDVIELGHVKLKFVGPNDQVAIPASDSADVTQESSSTPTSKAPLFAVLAAVLVIILGGGGYVFFKSRQPPPAPPGPTTRPPKPPDPTVKSTSPTVPPAAAPVDVDAKLAEAKDSIAALDWDHAELVLNQCKVDGALHPGARALLAQMSSEKGFKRALDEAEALLEAGELEKADTQIKSAADTKLLKDRFDDLSTRHSELVQKKLAERQPKQPKVDPPKVDPVKSPLDNPEAEALVEEGKKLLKEQQPEAAVIRLERCVKLYPNYYPCYVHLASGVAKVATKAGNQAGFLRAQKYYERYVELAPPDDKLVPKVREILKNSRQQQPQTP